MFVGSGRENLFVGVVGPGLMFAVAQYLVLTQYTTARLHAQLQAGQLSHARVHSRRARAQPADLRRGVPPETETTKTTNYCRTRVRTTPQHI